MFAAVAVVTRARRQMSSSRSVIGSVSTARRSPGRVVQQGMDGDRRQARRHHWLSEALRSFVDEPHAASDGVEQGVIINLTDRRAEASRRR